MTYGDQTTDPVARLTAHIKRLEERIGSLERRGLVLPVLDSDPVVGDPTNLWMLNDGRLRARDAENRIREYRPHDQQYIPTLATDPSTSSGIKLWFKPDGQLRGYLADNTLVKYQKMRIIPTVSSVPAASTDINIWVNTAGNLGIRMANDTVTTFTADAAGSSSGSTNPNSGDTGAGGGTSTDPKPAAPKPHQHQAIFTANAARCYCPVHGIESQLYYGRWSATHQERRVMFGFNTSSMQSTLSGATIISVQMRVKNLHSYQNSGVDIYWGAHDEPSLPASFKSKYSNVFKAHWPKVGGDIWRTMPDWLGYAFRDGTISGLTIDEPSTSRGYYGQIHPGLDLSIIYSHKH
jgi:hypothetical protein